MTPATKILLTALLVAPLLQADVDQGIAAFNAGRYSEARSILSQSSTDPVAERYLALTDAATGHCDSALPILTRPPLDKLAGIAAVKCFANSHDSAHEFALLAELQARFPNDADVLYLAARQHMQAFNDATFDMFQRAPSSYRVHELSAEIFEVENRFDDAASEYRKAIELNPGAPDLHFRLGRALLLQNHNPETLTQAAAQFEAELKLSPEDAACHFQLGQIAQVETKTQTAEAQFKQALKIDPNFVQAMLALANLDKNSPQAIALLTRAAELEPANEAAHYGLLTAYRKSGQMDKAREQKAILDKLQQPQDGEFSDFLKKLGEKPAQP